MVSPVTKEGHADIVARFFLVVLVVALWLIVARMGSTAESDATHEWILVNAMQEGLSPFEPISVLAEKLGAEYRSALEGQTEGPLVAYRAPGALVLMAPLLLVAWDQARAVLAVASLVSYLLLILWLVPRYVGAPLSRLVVPLGLITASTPILQNAFWATASSISAFGVGLLLWQPNSWFGGLGLGIATTLKFFPGLLGLPMLQSRRRWIAVVVPGFTILGLHFLGSAIFGLSLFSSTRLLLEGLQPWLDVDGNLSVSAWVARVIDDPRAIGLVLGVGIVGLAWVSWRWPVRKGVAAAIILAILVNPVSWTGYNVFLIPIAVLLVASGHGSFLGRLAGWTWIAVGLAALPLFALGMAGTALWLVVGARLFLLIGVLLSSEAIWSGSETGRPFLQGRLG